MTMARETGSPIRLLGRPEASAFVFLVLAVAVFGLTVPGFIASANLIGIVEQAAVVAIVALALNQVILAGEIDVSVGSLLAVCCFVFGNVAMATGGVVLPLAATLVAGGLVGLVSGALSTYGRVPSIITTLGMLFVLRGIVLILAGSQVLNLPADSRTLGLGTVAGVPASIVVLIGFALLVLWLSRNTYWGRYVYVVGGNTRAAGTLGLPAHRIRLLAFVLTGLACGLASAVFLGQIGQLQATAATGFELRAITAVVLGGTSIMGGRGSLSSPIIGALLVGVILNAMTLTRVPGTLELLVLGALILGAVALDGSRQRLTERSA